MAVINKQDTDGTRPLLDKGEFGYDDYPAGGDEGRLYVGTGAADIPQARYDEIDQIDNTSDADKPVSIAQQTALDNKVSTSSVQALDASNAIYITGQTLTITKGDGSTETATIPTTSAPEATETLTGTVELATIAETLAGIDPVKVVTPAGLNAVAGSIEGRLSTTASSLLLTGTVAINGNSVDVTDGGYIYTDGKNLDGSFNKVSEVVSGAQSFDLTGVSDGKKYLAREYGTGTLKVYDNVSTEADGSNLWFNIEDGLHYQSVMNTVGDGSTNLSTTTAVPNMSSATLPSGECSASSELSASYPAWHAFSTLDATYWGAVTGTTVGWIQYKFDTPTAINKIGVGGINIPARSPKDWTIKASNTGVFGGEEVVLDTVTGANITGVYGTLTHYFSFANSDSYLYYRMDISANNGDASYLAIGELDFIEAESVIDAGTPLTTPVSFISKYPYWVVSGAPQYEMVSEIAVSVNQMDSLELNRLTTSTINVSSLPVVDPLIKGELWNNSNVITLSVGV